MEHSLVDLLLLSLWALHTALAARATLSANPALPPAPAWAKGPEFRGKGHWEEYSVDQWRRNRDIINATDADGAEYDLLLFGDSITFCIHCKCGAEWRRQFPPAGEAPLRTWPAGVVGNDVQDLAWRLALGGERPARGPRVATVLIGVNNLSEHTPLPRLERMMGELLDWMSAAMPHTRLLLLGLTPTTAHDTRAANRRYRRLARERGIPFVRCGAGIDPSDASLILDGTHPTEAGGNIIVRCLGPAVRELLEEGAA